MTQSSQSAKRAQAKSGNSEECRREKREWSKKLLVESHIETKGFEML